MNYFIAGLYGDYDKYVKAKSSLRMKLTDHLWIVGDAISGRNPEGSIDILEDIASSKNISLILGDVEYMQIMRLMSEGDDEAEEEWAEEARLCDPDADLLTVAIKDLPQSRAKYLLEDFLLSCELSATLKIGDRWIYICHGCPQPYFGPSGVAEWQYSVATGKIKPERDYWASIKTDPNFSDAMGDNLPAKSSNTIIVTAGSTPSEAAAVAEIPESPSGIYYKSNVFIIGNAPDEDTPALGIDAAGFVVKRGF